MNKQNKIIFTIFIVVALVLAGYSIWSNNAPSKTVPANNGELLGGDRDEHGCIGSAGYSWCAPKNECLRIWEEQCYADLAQEIQYLLASKYERSMDEVQVTISKEVGDYASGGVRFGADDQGAGGLFLATKIDNAWQIVYDGNGSVDCAKLRQDYGFPEEVITPNFCD